MHQSAEQLSYRLIAGPADLRPLRILASRGVAWAGWQVALYVLGASHAVELRRGRARMTELLTCVPPPGAHASLMALSAAGSEGCCEAQGLRFRVRLASFDLVAGDDLLGCFDDEARLDVAFPPGAAGGAVTRIGWRIDARWLTVETVHSYPEEGRGIRSFTTFERKDQP
ncbi:MAG TPA: DUF2617 family protein [Chthonomonadaceae bacterium]|nr:DUF2617 family protein [Chthonomonadaceae bacterium]